MVRSTAVGALAFLIALAVWFQFTKVHTWNEINGETMGSTYRLEFGIANDRLKQRPLAELVNQLRRTIDQADTRLSTWNAASELSLFNAHQSTDWYPVDSSTVDLVAIAVEMNAVDSRFDVTVAPLSDLWGLGPRGQSAKVPNQQEIDQCLLHVSTDKLELRHTPPALRKVDPLVQIDLSALAAGYVVDRIVEQLRNAGASNFYIEIAGEIFVSGHNRRGSKWRVGIVEPQVGSQRIRTKLDLADCAIATSGNYRKFIEIDGKSYGHILDPNTGRPATTDILSATVLNSSCARADAMATLLLTMTAQEAIALANRRGWPTLLITEQEELQSESMNSVVTY